MNSSFGLWAVLMIVWLLLALITVSTIGSLTERKGIVTESVGLVCMTAVFLGLLLILA